jgi:hypothetical protein
MFKRLLKWGLGLFLLRMVLVAVFFLSLDSIFRVVIEHNIRAQTGMEAEIGKFHLGLTEPVIEIKDLELHNSAQFGGTPFLTIPEIHVEYDAAAFSRKEIHITLLRFNLGELDVVKSQDGLTNIFSMGLALPTKKSATTAADTQALADLKKQTDMDFKGIDCLNVSVGSFKYVDLSNQTNNREQQLAINNLVITNVTSTADLVGLGVLVGLRSGDFFRPLVDPNNSGAGQSAADLLKMLGH